MVCCDGCRSIWHMACAGLQFIPEGDFFCPLCCCSACGQACTGPRVDLDCQPELLPVVAADMQVGNEWQSPHTRSHPYRCPLRVCVCACLHPCLQSAPYSTSMAAPAQTPIKCALPTANPLHLANAPCAPSPCASSPHVPVHLQRYCKPGKLPKEHGYVSPVAVREWLRRGGHRPAMQPSGLTYASGLAPRQLGARGSGGGAHAPAGAASGGSSGADAETEDEGEDEHQAGPQRRAPPSAYVWQTLTSVDAFVALLCRLRSEEALEAKLGKVFPKSQGQPKRLQPLKDALPQLVPGFVWKVT